MNFKVFMVICLCLTVLILSEVAAEDLHTTANTTDDINVLIEKSSENDTINLDSE